MVLLTTPSSAPEPRGAQAGTGLAVYADLVFVTCLALATLGIALAFGRQGGPAVVRVPLGVLFVFVLPGYAIAAVLFPAQKSGTIHGSDEPTQTVSGTERLVLSVGLSVVAVPLTGLAVTVTPWKIGMIPVLVGVCAVTVLAASLGVFRRRGLPPENRFHVPVGRYTRRSVAYATRGVPNALLVVLIVLCAGGIGYAVAAPGTGEQYTELSLEGISTNGTAPVAGEYGTAFSLDESHEVHVAVANREHRTVEYTGVVLLQELRGVGPESQVARAIELDRFDTQLAHGQRDVLVREVRPPVTGELRLTVLLYRGEPPANPTMENAYRSVHHVVTVSD